MEAARTGSLSALISRPAVLDYREDPLRSLKLRAVLSAMSEQGASRLRVMAPFHQHPYRLSDGGELGQAGDPGGPVRRQVLIDDRTVEPVPGSGVGGEPRGASCAAAKSTTVAPAAAPFNPNGCSTGDQTVPPDEPFIVDTVTAPPRTGMDMCRPWSDGTASVRSSRRTLTIVVCHVKWHLLTTWVPALVATLEPWELPMTVPKSRPQPGPGAPLTAERERYLRLVAQGMSNVQACREVGVHRHHRCPLARRPEAG